MIGYAHCDECRRLLREYSNAVGRLNEASKSLIDVGVSLEMDLFNSIWERCEAARSRCVALRRLYVLHLDGHQK